MYQVYLSTYWYIPSLSEYMLIYTSMYQYCISAWVYIGIYQYVPCLSQYILLYFSIYQVYLSTYQYVLGLRRYLPFWDTV